MTPNYKGMKQKHPTMQQETQMKILMQKLRLLNNKCMHLTSGEKMSEINLFSNIFVKVKNYDEMLDTVPLLDFDTAVETNDV